MWQKNHTGAGPAGVYPPDAHRRCAIHCSAQAEYTQRVPESADPAFEQPGGPGNPAGPVQTCLCGAAQAGGLPEGFLHVLCLSGLKCGSGSLAADGLSCRRQAAHLPGSGGGQGGALPDCPVHLLHKGGGVLCGLGAAGGQHPQFAGHNGKTLAVYPGPCGLHIGGAGQNTALERGGLHGFHDLPRLGGTFADPLHRLRQCFLPAAALLQKRTQRLRRASDVLRLSGLAAQLSGHALQGPQEALPGLTPLAGVCLQAPGVLLQGVQGGGQLFQSGTDGADGAPELFRRAVHGGADTAAFRRAPAVHPGGEVPGGQPFQGSLQLREAGRTPGFQILYGLQQGGRLRRGGPDGAHGARHIPGGSQGGGCGGVGEGDQVLAGDIPQQQNDRPGGHPEGQRRQKEQQPQRPGLPGGGIGRGGGQDGEEGAYRQHPGGQRAAYEADQGTAFPGLLLLR